MNQGYCPTCGQLYPSDETTFGGRVQAARIDRGLTRVDLAEKVGYTRSTVITKWETGQAPMPDSLDLIEKVADALDLNPAYLMFGLYGEGSEPKGTVPTTTSKEDV